MKTTPAEPSVDSLVLGVLRDEPTRGYTGNDIFRALAAKNPKLGILDVRAALLNLYDRGVVRYTDQHTFQAAQATH